MPIASAAAKPSRPASSSARSIHGTATSTASLATPNSPRNCSARHSARTSAISEATTRLSLCQRHAVRQHAAAEVDRRGGEQSLGPKSRARGSRGESLLEAPIRFAQVDPPHPERPENDTEAQRVARLAVEEGVERRAQIRRVPVEPRCVALSLRQRKRPAGMPLEEPCRFAGLIEPLSRVQANRLEQPIPALASALVDRDE